MADIIHVQEDSEAFVLLQIPNATVTQVFDRQEMPIARGELLLECVSAPIPREIGHQTANPFAASPNDPATPTHDLWLHIRVGEDFEYTLVPDQLLEARPPRSSPQAKAGSLDLPSYVVTPPDIPGASLVVSFAAPRSAGEMANMESLETLLHQYRALGAEDSALYGMSAPLLGAGEKTGGAPTIQGPASEDLKGQLVLIDEGTGEVLGQLDAPTEAFHGVESQPAGQPVLLEFSPEAYLGRPVKVTQVPANELNDWMLKSATLLSKGILAVGAVGSNAMMGGARMFQKHTAPAKKPITFSPATQANIQRVHGATSKTAGLTYKTAKGINGAIQTVITGKDGRSTAGIKSSFMQGWGSTPGTGPRPGGYAGGGAAALQAGSSAGAPSLPVRPGAASEKPAIPPRGEKGGSEHPPSYATGADSGAYYPEKAAQPGVTQYEKVDPINTDTTSGKKRPFMKRALLAADVILSSVEAAGSDLITAGAAATSSAAGHRYGADAGNAAALLGGSVRNVALVYVDVRGVGRRGLLRSTAKGYVKARLKTGETVKIQGQGEGLQAVQSPGTLGVGPPTPGNVSPNPGYGATSPVAGFGGGPVSAGPASAGGLGGGLNPASAGGLGGGLNNPASAGGLQGGLNPASAGGAGAGLNAGQQPIAPTGTQVQPTNEKATYRPPGAY